VTDSDEPRKTMTREGKMNTYRTTARIVGAMYLAGFVVGIGGIVLIQSILGAPDHLATLPANSMLLAIGAVLWLMAVAWDAAHGVLMFPILKQHNERIAVGYLGSKAEVRKQEDAFFESLPPAVLDFFGTFFDRLAPDPTAG
jgi:hypothetical protein